MCHRRRLYSGAIALTHAVGLIWVPLDSASGLVGNVRRKVVIDDPMAPTVAALFAQLGSVVPVLSDCNATKQSGSDRATWLFLVPAIIYLSVVLVLMRWAGPWAVALVTLGGRELDYRWLRDTAPWRYIDFVLGGWVMVIALVTPVDRRLLRRVLFSDGICVAVLIAIFDLPLKDLLLRAMAMSDDQLVGLHRAGRSGGVSDRACVASRVSCPSASRR